MTRQKAVIVLVAITLALYSYSCSLPNRYPPPPKSSPAAGHMWTWDSPVRAVAADGNQIGSYETPIKDDSKGRMVNIRLVSSKLNGKVIEPGGEFSFNRAAGPRTMKRGYRKATIFVDGKKVKEFGGGICQVASTVYNAAMDAGMKITERHPHGQRVHYVEEGLDATVFYNKLDLKFRNTLPCPVKLEVSADSSSVAVRLVKLDGGA